MRALVVILVVVAVLAVPVIVMLIGRRRRRPDPQAQPEVPDHDPRTFPEVGEPTRPAADGRPPPGSGPDRRSHGKP